MRVARSSFVLAHTRGRSTRVLGRTIGAIGRGARLVVRARTNLGRGTRCSERLGEEMGG
jgi:hypothetical protein